ncbi:MAG: iron hydrogenase [Patescibacteria group bacterium]|nr:iron hydrogenase [Patescibacteria group bacterium]
MLRNIVKTNILAVADAKIIANFLFLAGLSILIPAFFHIQFITGPMINAILFLSVVLLGRSSALLIGMIPSVIALSFGLLPALLAPMVPFIMLSNAILIMVFSWLEKKYWAAVLIASTAKFLFLYFSCSIIMDLIFKKELALKISQILGWTQLATAILGGIIAFLILKSLKIWQRK